MALVRFRQKTKNSEKLYHNKDAVHNLIHYAFEPEKTPHRIWGGIGASIIDESTAIEHFLKVKEIFRNTKGKQLIHFWVSFENGEIENLQDYLSVGYEIADFFKGQYQVVFALHENTETYHIHFVVNTVNFITGKKLRWQKGSWRRLQKYITCIMNTRLY